LLKCKLIARCWTLMRSFRTLVSFGALTLAAGHGQLTVL